MLPGRHLRKDSQSLHTQGTAARGGKRPYIQGQGLPQGPRVTNAFCWQTFIRGRFGGALVQTGTDPNPRGLRSGLAKPGPCLSCSYKDQAGGDAEDSFSEHLPRPREEGDPTPRPSHSPPGFLAPSPPTLPLRPAGSPCPRAPLPLPPRPQVLSQHPPNSGALAFGTGPPSAAPLWESFPADRRPQGGGCRRTESACGEN